jgi:hypothetical protein
LVGIAAVSAGDVWAVGANRPFTQAIFGQSSRPVVDHWDGRAWRVVPTPRLPSSSYLGGVAALSRTDVWAVGQVGTRPLYEHWNGSRWRAFVAQREGRLSAVDGTSGRNVWAVGARGLTSYTIHDLRGLAMRGPSGHLSARVNQRSRKRIRLVSVVRLQSVIGGLPDHLSAGRALGFV